MSDLQEQISEVLAEVAGPLLSMTVGAGFVDETIRLWSNNLASAIRKDPIGVLQKVTTVEELEALPEDSVVINFEAWRGQLVPLVFVRDITLMWFKPGILSDVSSSEVPLPVIVAYRPDAPSTVLLSLTQGDNSWIEDTGKESS